MNVGDKIFVRGFWGTKDEGVVFKRLGSSHVLVKSFESGRVKSYKVDDLERVD